jgi:hypothetical protein
MSPVSMCGAPQPEEAARQGEGRRQAVVGPPAYSARREPDRRCRNGLPSSGTVPRTASYDPAVARDLVVRTAEPDPSISVYPHRGKQALVLAGSLAFVAGSTWLVTFHSLRAVVAGWIGIVVFGLCAVLALRLMLRSGPAVVIDTRGITDRSSVIAAGFVPWQQVTGLSIWRYRGQRVVRVGVLDPLPVLAAAGSLTRTAMRANIRLAGSPVMIAATVLPMTAEQLIEEIAAFRR